MWLPVLCRIGKIHPRRPHHSWPILCTTYSPAAVTLTWHHRIWQDGTSESTVRLPHLTMLSCRASISFMFCSCSSGHLAYGLPHRGQLPKDHILAVQASQYKRGFPAVQPLAMQYAKAWSDRTDAAMISNLRRAEVRAAEAGGCLDGVCGQQQGLQRSSEPHREIHGGTQVEPASAA